MNEDQIEEIKVQLNSLAELEIKKLVAEAHPDINYDEHAFGEFYISDFIILSERLIKQFKVEFDGQHSFLLPDGYFPEVIPFNLNRNQGVNWPSMGVISLRASLAQFYQYINEKNFEAAPERLKQLIAYQRQNGFWDRSERPIHDMSAVNVEQIKNEIETAKEQQEVMLESLRELTTEYSNRTAELERWASTAQTRLEEATEAKTQIGELLNHSTANDATLKEITSNQNDVFGSAKEIQSSLMEQLEEATEGLKQIQQTHDKSVECQEEIEGKRDEIYDLTGMAGSASLGSKFEDRRRSLKNSSSGWLIAIGISVLLSAGWLAYASLTLQPSDTTNAWLAFVWKLGLITPVAFLLGFVGKQYSKERTLEEEYAFRSALAMTLNAFGEQLEVVKGNEERKRLIFETVEKLYRTPKSLQIHESSSLPHVRNRSYKEAIETLTATVEKLSKLNSD